MSEKIVLTKVNSDNYKVVKMTNLAGLRVNERDFVVGDFLSHGEVEAVINEWANPEPDRDNNEIKRTIDITGR